MQDYILICVSIICECLINLDRSPSAAPPSSSDRVRGNSKINELDCNIGIYEMGMETGKWEMGIKTGIEMKMKH